MSAALHHRSGGGLYGPEAFIPAREDVKGDAAAAAKREQSFAAGRIPLDAEGKRARIEPAPVVMGALPPLTVRPATKEKPAMPARKYTSEERDALREQLRAVLPATRAVILERIPWYGESDSNEASLTKDLHAIGADAPERRGGTWTLAPSMRVPDAPAPAPKKVAAKAAPVPAAVDLSAVSTADLAAELVRRAEKHDRVVAALRGLAS